MINVTNARRRRPGVSGWLGELGGGVCARHGEDEDLLLTFTLNPAEPPTAGMPLTLTPSGQTHSTLVHALASRLGELPTGSPYTRSIRSS